jgi:hypothetical protein
MGDEGPIFDAGLLRADQAAGGGMAIAFRVHNPLYLKAW